MLLEFFVVYHNSNLDRMWTEFWNLFFDFDSALLLYATQTTLILSSPNFYSTPQLWIWIGLQRGLYFADSSSTQSFVTPVSESWIWPTGKSFTIWNLLSFLKKTLNFKSKTLKTIYFQFLIFHLYLHLFWNTNSHLINFIY